MRKASSGRFNYYNIGATYIRANVLGAEVIDAPPKGLKFHDVQEAPKHVHFLSTCKEVTNPEGLNSLGRRMLSDGTFAYTRPGESGGTGHRLEAGGPQGLGRLGMGRGEC